MPTVTLRIDDVLTTGALAVTVTVTDGTDTITESLITEEFSGLTPEQIQAKFTADIAPNYIRRFADYKAAKKLVGQTFDATTPIR